jgi:hypothetical protein
MAKLYKLTALKKQHKTSHQLYQSLVEERSRELEQIGQRFLSEDLWKQKSSKLMLHQEFLNFLRKNSHKINYQNKFEEQLDALIYWVYKFQVKRWALEYKPKLGLDIKTIKGHKIQHEIELYLKNKMLGDNIKRMKKTELLKWAYLIQVNPQGERDLNEEQTLKYLFSK